MDVSDLSDEPDPDQPVTEASLAAQLAGAQPVPVAAGSGWYPDPWAQDSRRYWTGWQWTSQTFPDRTVGTGAGAAARAGESNPFASPASPPQRPPQPPAPVPFWVAPTPAPPPVPVPAPDVGEPPAAEPPGSVWPVLLSIGAVVVAVALILGFVVLRGAGSPSPQAGRPFPSAPGVVPTPIPSPSAPTPPPTRPGQLAGLAELGLRPSDVPPGVLVLPIAGGTQVAGRTTLDLCDATYPSESERLERVQVAAAKPPGEFELSTETVRYRSQGAVTQAWAEITAAAADCASTAPGTVLNLPPDSSWPVVDGVRRLAYDLSSVDAQGGQQHTVVVYLSRGNILMGVYFPQPDGPQIAVLGKTTIPAIVAIFEQRLAQLPPAGLSGSASDSGGGQSA